MPTEKKKKNASFHRAYLLQDGARKDPGEQEWAELLEKVSNLSLNERTVNELIFEPTMLDKGTLLGMHKPINPDFMSRINPKDGKIADFMAKSTEVGEDEESRLERFANSTAVCFLPIGNVFALSLGNNVAPRAPQLAHFLDTFLPPESNNAFWKIEPLVDDDEIRKLKEAKGLVAFSSRFNTARNLFNADEESNGVVSFGEQIAQRVGGDVEITIEVKLKPAARNTSVKGKLLSLFMRDLPKLVGKDSNAKAKAMMSAGIEEELSLVEHNLAAEFEIDKLANESHQFSELLQTLGNVSAEMETKVKSILEGSDSLG